MLVHPLRKAEVSPNDNGKHGAAKQPETNDAKKRYTQIAKMRKSAECHHSAGETSNGSPPPSPSVSCNKKVTKNHVHDESNNAAGDSSRSDKQRPKRDVDDREGNNSEGNSLDEGFSVHEMMFVLLIGVWSSGRTSGSPAG